MNCMWETVGTIFFAIKDRFLPEPIEENICTAQVVLEESQKNMRQKKQMWTEEAQKLMQQAVSLKAKKDMAGARSKVSELKRVMDRIGKLDKALSMMNKNLDTIKMTELDKEIMMTLKQSTSALRKAGMGIAVQDAENVMGELDNQLREIQDVSAALATPIDGSCEQEELDLEEELAQMEPLLCLSRDEMLGEEHAPSRHAQAGKGRIKVLPRIAEEPAAVVVVAPEAVGMMES